MANTNINKEYTENRCRYRKKNIQTHKLEYRKSLNRFQPFNIHAK